MSENPENDHQGSKIDRGLDKSPSHCRRRNNHGDCVYENKGFAVGTRGLPTTGLVFLNSRHREGRREVREMTSAKK